MVEKSEQLGWGPRVRVCADEHPDPQDPWVLLQAAVSAAGYGWTLGDFEGTFDARPHEACAQYHQFLASVVA